MEKRSFLSELRAAPSGKLVGYAAVFNQDSVDMGFIERIKPGAFAKALKKSDVRALFNHDSNFVLGRQSAGTLKLKEDSKGLYIEIDPPGATWATDLRESIRRGDIDQMSFGFTVASGGERWEGNTRVLTEIDQLFDVSPVTFPAYPTTEIQSRSRRGVKMKYKREHLGRIYNDIEKIMTDFSDKRKIQMSESEGEDLAALFDEWDRIAPTIDPRAPLSRNVGFEGIREWANQSDDEPHHLEPIGNDGYGQHFGSRSNHDGKEELRSAFNRYLLEGAHALTQQEYRSLIAGEDVQGGYLIAPQQFVKKLIQELDAEVAIRKMATTYEVKNAESLGVPTLDSDFDDSDWTTELQTGSEDDLGFGKRELRPYPTAKRVKVSNKLLRTAALAPEALVRQRLSYKFGVTEEKAFLTGDGHGKPLGVFTASDDGIPTSRDVSTDNTTTSPTADGLIEAFHGLKPQYRKNAVWLFHDDVIKKIRKLKDADDHYLWQQGLSVGQPPTILGKPYITSEWAPNTFTTGQYVGILADWRFYWIATALNAQVQRLVELYAETNQTGYIGRMEVDGMPVLASAFVRVQLG